MSYSVDTIRLRGVLNSAGGVSVEADLRLADGASGTASVPVAIAPGRREARRSVMETLGPIADDDPLMARVRRLTDSPFDDQGEFDAVLDDALDTIGGDIALALSLALARAVAEGRDQSLADYLGHLYGGDPGMPRPLANLFSGGIHGADDAVPFQQIMIAPRADSLVDNVEAVLAIYGDVEQGLEREGRLGGYSASSGMLVQDRDARGLLEDAATAIDRHGLGDEVGIAIDVAAEHLKTADGRYRFGGRTIDGEELARTLRRITDDFPVDFIEDPFDPDDVDLWRDFTADLSGRLTVVGDDLFATSRENIDPALANGILLKMNQVGTVSGTLNAARTARDAGMRLYLSHRSRETEDVAMCDLAVALAADGIKIGGPRRGDRVGKYNRLLRLAESTSMARHRRVA